ncbi:MAG: NHL repeat-containing protein [Acidobacteriota bacterium]
MSLSLTGCTLATTAAPAPAPTLGPAIAGTVHGGQQPVSGARIYLLAANPGGYGAASLSLLTWALTGNAVDSIGAYTSSTTGGAFDITGDYSCTAAYPQGASTSSGGITLPGDEQVYLYVTGGNPGTGAGANSSIGLLAALGPCNAQFSSTLVVNEITTVAAAYALAGYATDATHISSSGSALALLSLHNAGLNSQNLANVATGAVPSTTAGHNGIPPSANIVTIADILAACINGASGNSSCSTLFQYTAGSGATGTPATDTASAAINLAHNPYPTAAGMTALYGLSTGTPAFAAGLSTQPNDFTLGITFTGGGFTNGSASALAIDASGNVWSTSGSRLCKFGSNGVAISNSSGYTGGGLYTVKNIAVDTSGNVWAPNLYQNSLSEFSNTGAAISGSSGYSGAAGGISQPLGVAIDATGNVWIANQSGTLSKYSNSGTAISGSSGYTDGGNDAFYGVAIDIVGNVWAANYNNGSVSKFSSDGASLSGRNGFYGGYLYNPYAIAIDASNNVWVPDYYSSTLHEFSDIGAVLSGTGGYAGGGLNSPESIALDASGRAWAANFNGNTVSVFTNTGAPLSPSPGYNANSGIYGPVNIALDGSGDVWVTNYNGSLTQLIGAGTPVVTPIAANLASPYGSAAVNRP